MKGVTALKYEFVKSKNDTVFKNLNPGDWFLDIDSKGIATPILKVEETEDFNGVAANGNEFYFENEAKVKLITVHCEGIFSLNGVEIIPSVKVLNLISGEVIFKDKDFWLILSRMDSNGNDYAANLRNGIVIPLKDHHSYVYNFTDAFQLMVMGGD
jgi:hypothetical protein